MAGEVIEGEVVGAELREPSEAREGYLREVTAALGSDRSDSGAGGSPTRSEAEGHALSPHQELPGKWEQYAELLSEGKDAAEAQRLAGVSPKLALRWIKREETAQRVVFLVRQRVRRESGKAQAVVSHLLDARSERVRLDAALAILDRSGVSEGASVTSPVTVVIDLSGR